MQTRIRAVFLLVSAAIVFHLPYRGMVALILGYFVCEQLDVWLTRRAKFRAIDDEVSGWIACEDDPEYEEKDDILRARLTGSDQVIVARIADLTRRTINVH